MSGLFRIIRSAVTGGGLEMAPYKVIRQGEGYEERVYPAQKWVRTRMENVSMDAVTSSMFRKLFNYISGQNDKQVKIPMTAPVSILIEPGAGPNCASTFSMAFYIPAAFQNPHQTPNPTDADVSIEDRPEFTVLARRAMNLDPLDEVTLVEQAKLFGEMIQDNKETGIYFDCYFSINYFPLGRTDQEIWFVKSMDE